VAQARRPRKWSAKVVARSDALDLEKSIFRAHDAKRIAASLKRSAERSKRRKGTPFQSAMSMLNFYINRAGKNLSATEKRKLERAKTELRRQFGREPK
jgi:hypothetical protein